MKRLSSRRWLLLAGGIVAAALVLLMFRSAPRNALVEEEREAGSPSGAKQALDFWAAQRAYPNRVIPDVGFAAAWDQTRQMAHQRSSIDEGVPPWSLLGPTNIGGRTLCLALRPGDPAILYAGSASGGLWKSTTGGVGADAWDYVETGFPVLAVSTIAVDSESPDVMYVGTGEVYHYQDSIGGDVIRTTRGSYGIGILKTTDGGATWAMSLDWRSAQTRGVWMIKIHPTDPNILYAATTEGVYKSTDAGGTWSPVLNVLMATDVRIHPTNPGTVFAACGNFGSAGLGIYRSTDGGQAWTRLTGGLPSSWNGKAQLDIAPTSPNLVYASIADSSAGRGLYRSTNTGDTWQLVNSTDYPTYQGWYSHYVLISPFDANKLFVGGIEIWGSTNGGTTLTQRSVWTEAYYGTSPPEGPIGGPHYAHADHHFAVWHPTDPNTIFFTSDGGIFKSTDGGNTFQSLIGGYATTQFYNGFASSATSPNRAIGGLQDNFTAIYDGGVPWRRVIGGDGCWGAINQSNDNTMYGEYQYLSIQRSRNAGSSWTGISPPTQSGDVTAFSGPYVLSPSSPTVLYAGRSRVYRSTNEGSSWTATNGGAPLDASFNPMLSLTISGASPDTVYAGAAPIFSRARVFRTTNSGTTWQDITGPLPDRYPSDLAVDPHTARTVYATFMGFGSSHVFRSSDAGSSWQDIGAGLPDVPASAVEVDPDHSEVVYVGTDLGVFISTDSGQSWSTYQIGMPTAMVNDLKVFRPGRKLRAATHGNAAFERGLYEPGPSAVVQGPGSLSMVGLRIHPNPVEPGSRVRFDLPRATAAHLALYDVRGKQVATLYDGPAGAGPHDLAMDALRLPAGVYYLRLETREGARNARVVYLR